MESPVSQNQTTSQNMGSFFGEFAKPQFYLELAQTAIREVVRAAILAFAGTLTYHIQNKLTAKVAFDPGFGGNGNMNNNNNSATAASRAFQVQDTTNYSSNRSSYTPSMMNSGSGTSTFPGFGSPRQ